MNKRNFNWGELRGGGLNRRVLFHSGTFAQIVSLDNLFLAWKSYRKGKRGKKDVQRFEFNLEDNIFQLHEDLVSGQYRPSGYQQFRITDPKSRLISKASVRDRLFHQAIYQILYPLFDRKFIFDGRISKRVSNFKHLNLTAYLNVFNLANSKYWQDFNFPLPGRYFEGGMTVEF